MSSYDCTSEGIKVGGHYQYQPDRLSDFTEKEILEVELVKDESDDKDYHHTFKPLEEVPEDFELDKDGTFEVIMMKGDFYFPGMTRIWDEGEYI